MNTIFMNVFIIIISCATSDQQGHEHPKLEKTGARGLHSACDAHSSRKRRDYEGQSWVALAGQAQGGHRLLRPERRHVTCTEHYQTDGQVRNGNLGFSFLTRDVSQDVLKERHVPHRRQPARQLYEDAQTAPETHQVNQRGQRRTAQHQSLDPEA